MPAKPRIGMIGKGNVGTALTKGLTGVGYAVDTTGKDPGRVREVAKRADVLVLAVPFGERANAVKALGEAANGKPLVDVTNAVTPNYDFAASVTRSGAEELQAMAPEAKVVKAFNTVFAQNMTTGKVAGEPLALFVAGDDAEAKRRVLEMGHALGFDPIDAGPLKNARWLEPLGYLNIQLGYTLKLGTDIGLRLVHAKAAKTPRPAEARAR